MGISAMAFKVKEPWALHPWLFAYSKANLCLGAGL